MTEKRQNDLSCDVCGARCCRYMALEIDEPTSKRDYDHIRWFLLHKDVHVFIDHEEDWYIEFETRCEELGKDNRCGNYKSRPRICRRHGEHEECEFLSDEEPHIVRFSMAHEFEQYMDEQGIKWKWKKK